MRQGSAGAGLVGLVLAALVGLPGAGAAQTPVTPAPTHPADVPPSVTERALEARTKGPAGASVVVFEIADFQCPYCARFSEEVAPRIDELYVDAGLVQWVFVNLPLQSHPLAWHAAEAALCAGAVGGQFWGMHDLLFAEQDEWTGAADARERFAGYASGLGVPAEAYATCTEQDQVATLILQDFASAVSAGINGTPTFIVMKDEQVVERLVGVQPVETWTEILDGALGR